MLATAVLQTIVCTSRIADAERFYSGILELPLKRRSHGALVYDVGGGDLLVSPVPSVEPSAHTVVGFSVPDVAAVVAGLRDRGVELERFEVFRHDADGVVTLPDGSRVAWFRDGDGNLLSIVQYA